ncbi:MAG: hypothetical protein RSD36_13495 [Terrisporobacter sp.]
MVTKASRWRYNFLIQDDSLYKKFKEIKESAGGIVNMGIDEIREKYLEEKGKEEGIKEGIKEGKEEGKEEGIKEVIGKLLTKGKNVDEVSDLLDVSIEMVNEVKNNMK